MSVPVTESLMQQNPAEDGTNRLDPEKVFDAAVELGKGEASWIQEAQQVAVHPTQGPPPSAE